MRYLCVYYKKISSNGVIIKSSKYGLAQLKDDGSISLIDKVNEFKIKKIVIWF